MVSLNGKPHEAVLCHLWVVLPSEAECSRDNVSLIAVADCQGEGLVVPRSCLSATATRTGCASDRGGGRRGPRLGVHLTQQSELPLARLFGGMNCGKRKYDNRKRPRAATGDLNNLHHDTPLNRRLIARLQLRLVRDEGHSERYIPKLDARGCVTEVTPRSGPEAYHLRKPEHLLGSAIQRLSANAGARPEHHTNMTFSYKRNVRTVL